MDIFILFKKYRECFIWFQDNSPLGNCPLDNCYPGQLLPGQLPPPRTIAAGQFPHRAIAPWTIIPDNSHLGLLHCPRISTSGQLLPRAITITNYNFSWLFSVSFTWPSYIISVVCYDNKNNNENTKKTWSLKLLSIIIM